MWPKDVAPPFPGKAPITGSMAKPRKSVRPAVPDMGRYEQAMLRIIEQASEASGHYSFAKRNAKMDGRSISHPLGVTLWETFQNEPSEPSTLLGSAGQPTPRTVRLTGVAQT